MLIERNAFIVSFFGVLAGIILGTELMYSLLPGVLMSPQSSFSVCLLNESYAVYYLYPKRCIACEINIPPSCDGCHGFYDEQALSAVSSDLGVPLFFVVSEAVSDASLMIMADGRALLGSAKSKLMISQAVCAATGVKESCGVYSDYLSTVISCFEDFGFDSSALIYHHGGGCVHCSEMEESVRELMNLSYEGSPYSVVWLSEDDESEKEVLQECVGSILDLRYIPQVICPANVKTHVGAMDLSQLRDFADECIEASELTS